MSRSYGADANEERIIQGVSLYTYYNDRIVPLDKKFTTITPSHHTGLCPFHEDTDPSLHVWKRKNIFHCFGCGYGGDVIKTHMRLQRQYYRRQTSRKDAMEELATLYKIELDLTGETTSLSVFERAKKQLLDRTEYRIPKGTMTKVEFRKLNDRVRNTNIPIHSKQANFAQMDLITSVQSYNVSRSD